MLPSRLLWVRAVCPDLFDLIRKLVNAAAKTVVIFFNIGTIGGPNLGISVLTRLGWGWGGEAQATLQSYSGGKVAAPPAPTPMHYQH